MEIGEMLSLGLAVLGGVLMLFGLGAISGWAWAVKSLEVPPPRWIAGVVAAAGTAFVASAVLRSDWLSALTSAALFAIIVAGQLRIGPWRRRSGG